MTYGVMAFEKPNNSNLEAYKEIYMLIQNYADIQNRL